MVAYLLWNKVRQFRFQFYQCYYCFRCRMRFSKKRKRKKYTFISTYNTCTYIDVCMQLRHIVSLFMILITDENDILFKCNTCSLFMITRIYYKLLNVISYYFQQFFIMHKCKYLTNSWNSIDAFIYSSLIAITVY